MKKIILTCTMILFATMANAACEDQIDRFDIKPRPGTTKWMLPAECISRVPVELRTAEEQSVYNKYYHIGNQSVKGLTESIVDSAKDRESHEDAMDQIAIDSVLDILEY